MRKIPIDRPYTSRIDNEDYQFINYRDEIFIIKESKEGNLVNYQYSGTSCLQGKIKGFIYKSFKNKLKWFKTKTWDNKTEWSSNPQRIYFSKKEDFKFVELFSNKFSQEEQDRRWKIIDQRASETGTPVKHILTQIITEVRRKTHINFEFDFDNFEYGKHWFEAHIPLVYKNKKYLLTWMNCD